MAAMRLLSFAAGIPYGVVLGTLAPSLLAAIGLIWIVCALILLILFLTARRVPQDKFPD